MKSSRKDLPVIFSPPMALALWQDRKTETRRMATSPLRDAAIGTRLWVREGWRAGYGYDCYDETLGRCPRPSDMEPGSIVEYLASDIEPGGHPELGGRNRSSLHMPRWASRLTLVLEAKRFERLNLITDAGAMAEGVRYNAFGDFYLVPGVQHPNKEFPFLSRATPREMYAALWDVLHGSGAWLSDPLVLVLTFKVHKLNIDKVET